MTCPHCDKPNTFNMNWVTCVAKKVVRDGRDKSERFRLITQYSSHYELDIEAVKSEVTRLFSGMRSYG